MAQSNMVTPVLEREAETRNYAKFNIGPLEQGYGVQFTCQLFQVISI